MVMRERDDEVGVKTYGRRDGSGACGLGIAGGGELDASVRVGRVLAGEQSDAVEGIGHHSIDGQVFCGNKEEYLENETPVK